MLQFFWNWNWWKVDPKEFTWNKNFPDVFGSLWVSEVLRIASVRTWNGIVIAGIRVDLVRIEVPRTSVGDIISMISVLFIYAFKITENYCVWEWKPALVLRCDFCALISSLIIDWFERMTSLLWSIGLLAVMASVITLGRYSKWENF